MRGTSCARKMRSRPTFLRPLPRVLTLTGFGATVIASVATPRQDDLRRLPEDLRLSQLVLSVVGRLMLLLPILPAEAVEMKVSLFCSDRPARAFGSRTGSAEEAVWGREVLVVLEPKRQKLAFDDVLGDRCKEDAGEGVVAATEALFEDGSTAVLGLLSLGDLRPMEKRDETRSDRGGMGDGASETGVD